MDERGMKLLIFIWFFLFSIVLKGYDVFIDLEEEGTSLDDTKTISSTNNDGLSKRKL